MGDHDRGDHELSDQERNDQERSDHEQGDLKRSAHERSEGSQFTNTHFIALALKQIGTLHISEEERLKQEAAKARLAAGGPISATTALLIAVIAILAFKYLV